MSKKQTSGHYHRRGGRVVYELKRGDGTAVTLTHPTGNPARDERLARLLATMAGKNEFINGRDGR